MNVYPDKTVLRPLGIGSRLHFHHSSSNLDSGATRKNHSQANLIILDSTGRIWKAKCIQWQYSAIWEVTGLIW